MVVSWPKAKSSAAGHDQLRPERPACSCHHAAGAENVKRLFQAVRQRGRLTALWRPKTGRNRRASVHFSKSNQPARLCWAFAKQNTLGALTQP